MAFSPKSLLLKVSEVKNIATLQVELVYFLPADESHASNSNAVAEKNTA